MYSATVLLACCGSQVVKNEDGSGDGIAVHELGTQCGLFPSGGEDWSFDDDAMMLLSLGRFAGSGRSSYGNPVLQIESYSYYVCCLPARPPACLPACLGS
jgi:hypothetical protein